MVEVVTVDQSMTKACGVGVVSVVLQFGPRDPMNVVLPMRTLSCTVKFRAEEMAMPYPNAPVKELLYTVPDKLTLFR